MSRYRRVPLPGATYFLTLSTYRRQVFLAYEVSVDLLINLPDSEVLDIFSRLNSYAVVRQITVAAFLHLFVSWETFLEESLVKLMAGNPTISGRAPVRYVSPPTVDAARRLVIGVQRYFDYGNHDNVRKIVSMYFANGYPFEAPLSAIHTDLSDLRTIEMHLRTSPPRRRLPLRGLRSGSSRRLDRESTCTHS